MTNNVSAVMDDSYNYSMWVELYNTGEASQNQGTYYFTDDLSQPQKWQPLQKMIPAKGYSLLWFERSDRNGHANFKLKPEGGKLFLLNGQREIIDQVEYPQQYRNISYGRKQDGVGAWVYFSEYSQGGSNNYRKSASGRCETPIFSEKSGFYPKALKLTISVKEGEEVFYTTNGKEPTRSSTKYVSGKQISLGGISIIRARAFADDKLPGDVVTATYFINQRPFTLPVVSIVTDQANLTDDVIGIYVKGTNGIPGNGTDQNHNWNQDWDRPANFELFDKEGVSRLNQELDIAISGGWSRKSAQKSLKISPRKKFGENQLRYDFFPETKPYRHYKDIQLRNSGNDFSKTMMRDAFMQTLIIGRMDIDYLAYEPAICFINGKYYGIQNIRERSSKDYLFTNYGLNDDEFFLLETKEITTDPEFLKLTDYVAQNDVTQPEVYARVCEMMDVDNYINYLIAEIYYGNTDWPHNNFKVWKKKENGKWRWILYDTDFGFALNTAYSHNTLNYLLNDAAEWSAKLARRLMTNQEFKEKFIRRFCVQLSSTFETNRVNKIMDQLSSRISTEIIYHKSKYGGSSFNDEINKMKDFSLNRPDRMMGFLSNRFFNSTFIRTIDISSNIDRASYTFFSEKIPDNRIMLKYFNNQPVSIRAENVPGYTFKYWEAAGGTSNEHIKMGASWKYWDRNGIPAANWHTKNYSDDSWNAGDAQFGYGNKGEVTLIGYGNDANYKYPAAYFRKTVTVENIEAKDNFVITVYVDDGAAVYVNGIEVGRYNLPSGTLSFNTYANAYNNGDLVSFSVNKNMLVNGENLIAVEVHQCNATSSDLIFDLSFASYTAGGTQILESPLYTTVLNHPIKLKAIYDGPGMTDQHEDVKIFINEVVASNNQIKDEYGKTNDYIELYNPGDQDVDISGWYLSDDPLNWTLSRIPLSSPEKTMIPAKGRVIIWADGEPEKGALHAGFKLDKEGETVILSRQDPYGQLILVDAVIFPALDQNMSYSRLPDGYSDWVIQPPTFNESNGTPNPDPIPLGTDEKLNDLSEVYPTSVRDHFTVKNATGQWLKVVDMTGKVWLQKFCFSDQETIPAGYLPAGMYIVVLKNSTIKIFKE